MEIIRAQKMAIKEQEIMHRRGIGFLRKKPKPEDVLKIEEPWLTQQEFYDKLRNGVIEEVAQHVEKLTGFGQDTISSFAIYIRGMKR